MSEQTEHTEHTAISLEKPHQRPAPQEILGQAGRRGPFRYGERIQVTDTKGRTVIVPAAKLAYVEIGGGVVGQVGFRS